MNNTDWTYHHSHPLNQLTDHIDEGPHFLFDYHLYSVDQLQHTSLR